MEMHESGENYLETILMLKERMGQVRSIDIANEMGFTKPSISVAMKKLRENGYIEVDEEGYITLKDDGYEIATRIYERHKTVAQLLMLLGVKEETALDDACRMEHDISEESYQSLKKHYEFLVKNQA
ncbi:metal-dependent transcriptional regulator [Anoxybacterium hadale]|uniref:Metal-dependent transcriptional regulator n=1 Tax=Anoxybacterium hadale TaxID=3408580 RepID=A0ACD1AF39_9FIRM|nr:metal-dependent transcriptional regulator [Clostridiales bacterium]